MKRGLGLTAVFLAMLGCVGEDGSSSPSLLGQVPGDAICGSDSIIGTKEQSFSKGGCGIEKPVTVYAVGGVKLSTPGTMNCSAARALENWVVNSVQIEAKKLDTRVSEINNFQTYSCRTRNHKKGAKLSEHAKGNAIDIGGFTFENGNSTKVLSDYSKSTYKTFYSSIRKGACGPFGTVLGPGSDRYHADHFHLDVADYRSGPYCR